ncbi:MAG: anthranilate phosphoribosyltransferase [Acidimicrobiales bacterium]
MSQTSQPNSDSQRVLADIDEFGGWSGVLGSLVGGIDLTPRASGAALGSILAGEATDAQIAGFIVALGMKGGTVPELTGMVDAMMASAAPLDVPAGAIDIVGSGGAPTRKRHALSVSTMASIVASAGGASVCKHGSVKASSSSGAFDTLDALGVAIGLDGEAVARCVREIGLGYAFAKAFHPAMRFAGPVRSELGVPTLFNFLGPLSHPGGVKRQVVGVSDPTMAPRVAGVLASRGSELALVVHGEDGLDEITTTDLTRIYEVRDGEVAATVLFDPASIGVPEATADSLHGGSPEDNARIADAMFAGEDVGPRRDIVALNAGAGLLVAGLVDDLGAGFEAAIAAIESGAAAEKLAAIQRLSSELSS